MSKSYAQSIGINADGSAPDASAMLDVKNVNKGLLIPRVALTGTTDVATIASPAVSLLVYNTATTAGVGTAVTPGYYYWSGSAWLKFNTNEGSASGTSWLLTGNAGTDPALNFIGTTDAQPLVFKIHNMLSGKLETDNISFGVNALALNTTGRYNIAIGKLSLDDNTTGVNNTAIGWGTMQSNTSGNLNTAYGVTALANNITGSENTAVGS